MVTVTLLNTITAQNMIIIVPLKLAASLRQPVSIDPLRINLLIRYFCVLLRNTGKIIGHLILFSAQLREHVWTIDQNYCRSTPKDIRGQRKTREGNSSTLIQIVNFLFQFLIFILIYFQRKKCVEKNLSDLRKDISRQKKIISNRRVTPLPALSSVRKSAFVQ